MSKEVIFKGLHHTGKMVILPNVWDPLSAILLESLGYKAVATASASIALSNGFADGQKIPFQDVLRILRNIVNSVKIPVSADIEGAYANDDTSLKEHIKQLLDTGIAGINFEDSDHYGTGLIPTIEQCRKISLIKNTAAQQGSALFINARADINLRPGALSDSQKITELIKRGKAYRDAGADGFYPMILKDVDGIREVINEVKLPINILLFPGIPDLALLQKMGLARLSLGPGLLKIAINAMKNISEKLLHLEGMSEITGNPVTGDYLNRLITKTEIN
ncbi:MAG: isocitrate lyase/phosphoenolpyruvate mutase family protein [Ginsengibacter sp.]